MALKKNFKYKALIAVFNIWFASLLTVYIPMSSWVTPTFPLTINNYTLTFFVVSTGLAFSLALYLGLNELIEVESTRIRR